MQQELDGLLLNGFWPGIFRAPDIDIACTEDISKKFV